MELIQVMKALTDKTSLRILNLLRDGELCICEIEHLLGISQSGASKYLHRLTAARLISYEKTERSELYKINEEAIRRYPFIECLMNEELMRIEKFRSESEKLRRLKKSGLSCQMLTQPKANDEPGINESDAPDN